jgi:hypothetical protein
MKFMRDDNTVGNRSDSTEIAPVHIEPLATEDAERVSALAREIWLAHYPDIIGIEQIEYMLRQRYEPAVIRAELQRKDLWWDKLRRGEEIIAFSSYFLAGENGAMKLDKLYVRQDSARWRSRAGAGLRAAGVGGEPVQPQRDRRLRQARFRDQGRGSERHRQRVRDGRLHHGKGGKG